MVKHVKNEISKGNFVSMLSLKSSSIVSGQFRNIFINSSEDSFIFLYINLFNIIINFLYLPLKSITELFSLFDSSAIFLKLIEF